MAGFMLQLVEPQHSAFPWQRRKWVERFWREMVLRKNRNPIDERSVRFL